MYIYIFDVIDTLCNPEFKPDRAHDTNSERMRSQSMRSQSNIHFPWSFSETGPLLGNKRNILWNT